MWPFLLRLVLRNCLRHPLRTALTVLGIVVAITAFGLLRTTIDAWYAGADASSASRLVVRNKNSLTFSLPLYYRGRIEQLEGVKSVSYADWFGGIYIAPKNFFPRFAVEPRSYFALYPEFVVPPAQMKAFLLDRRGAIVGRKTAEKYGFEIGDQIPIIGDIFPGNWNFVLRGIYHGADSKTDESQFFLQWDNLNETMKKLAPDHANEVGIFLIALERPEDAALIAQRVDKLFANSRAETLTETEKAFQLSFVAMTEAILTVIQIVSFLIIVIIMAVMANTMAMTARERRGEYATLKAIGFNDSHVVALIAGESLLVSLGAGAIGIWLLYPLAAWVGHRFGSIFPIFLVAPRTPLLAAAMALLIGVVAAIAPSWRASTLKIAEGLRGIG